MLPPVIGAAGVVSLSFSYSFTNRFKHRLDVLIKNPVLEPENHNALLLQEPRALGLILLSQLQKVWRSVQFDRNVALHAEKIDNIAMDAVLSAELLAEKLPSLKVFPQDRFSRSAVVSQLLASIS